MAGLLSASHPSAGPERTRRRRRKAGIQIFSRLSPRWWCASAVVCLLALTVVVSVPAMAGGVGAAPGEAGIAPGTLAPRLHVGAEGMPQDARACLTPTLSARASGCAPNSNLIQDRGLAGALPNAPSWRELSPSTPPSPRQYSALAFDAVDSYLVLFGGSSIANYTSGTPVCDNDTWELSGAAWTRLTIPGPPGGCGGGMAYDTADQYLVFFGGSSTPYGAPDNHTWTFQHGAWTEWSIRGPPALIDPDLTYDAGTGSVILFGGIAQGQWNNHTWSFRAGVWTDLGGGGPGSVNPPVYHGASLSYDPVNQALVFYGGVLGTGGNTTWVYASGRWTGLQTPGPSARGGAMMASDPLDGFVVLFGGDAGKGMFNDTWTYAGGLWDQLLIPSPPPRTTDAIAFDPLLGGTVVFGGETCCQYSPTGLISDLNDTWLLAFPPMTLNLSIETQPVAVCSELAPECPSGTLDTAVTLSVSVATDDLTSAPPSSGLVTYGGLHWIFGPQFDFVPSEVASLDLAAGTSSTCRINGGLSGCPTMTAGPLTVGGPVGLEWGWPGGEGAVSLHPGDTWSGTFRETFKAEPGATFPVDACTTVHCVTAGSVARDGEWTSVVFYPFDNTTREQDSFDPASVYLTPPTTPPPQGGSPGGSPPPPGGTPLPAPPVPTPVSAPVPSPLPVFASPLGLPISLQALGVGLLGAGATAVAVRGRAQPVANAVRVGRRGVPERRAVDRE